MNVFLISAGIFAFLLARFAFARAIPWARTAGWVDHPSSRRRHSQPMPVVGGITLLACWLAACAGYVLMDSAFRAAHAQSLLVASLGIAAFCLLGLYDDLRGASPRLKLFLEFLIVAGVMLGMREVREFCAVWELRIGPVAWPLTAIWLVGVSNAINLVDGLDGLAAGISATIALCLAALAFQFEAALSFMMLVLLLPCLAAFLSQNWAPARVFLGDNGSLPIGFILGLSAVSGPVESASFVQVLGLIVMLGYPLLDMGLCTLRRLRHKAPIFKADRGHLHHRFLRMGIGVRSVVTLILAMTTYLQLCAFGIIEFSRSHEYPFGQKWMLINSVFFSAVASSLFYFLYFLKLLEQTRISELSTSLSSNATPEPAFKRCLVAKVHLDPLFEAGLFEEKARLESVLRTLNFLVESILQSKGTYFLSKRVMNLIFVGKEDNVENREEIRDLLTEKLGIFQSLFGIQYSSADLKITFDTQDHLVTIPAFPPPSPGEARQSL